MNTIKEKLLNQIDAQLEIERKCRTMTNAHSTPQDACVLDYEKVLKLFRNIVERTSEWTSINESLPSEDGSYLVCTEIIDDSSTSFFCDYSKDKGWMPEDKEDVKRIIAWQDIEPYKTPICLSKLEVIEQLKSLLNGGKNEMTGEEFDDDEERAVEKDRMAVECAIEYLKGDICYE